MATAAEIRSRVREFARELVAEQGRPEAGAGLALFTVLEDAAVAVGDALAGEIIEQELARSSEHGHDCPRCRQRGLRKGERERIIQTRRGEVKFAEPEFYCPRCRRAFFPSVGGVGLGR